MQAALDHYRKLFTYMVRGRHFSELFFKNLFSQEPYNIVYVLGEQLEEHEEEAVDGHEEISILWCLTKEDKAMEMGGTKSNY